MRKLTVALAVWLALILNPAFGDTELIVNGGFESSGASIAPWQIVASPLTAYNVLSFAGAFGGSSECLLLGDGNLYTQDVYQTITFPSNLISATLSFEYNVVTTDTSAGIDATLYIQFKDSNQKILLQNPTPASNLTYTGGYALFSAQIVSVPGSIFAGQTVTFHYLAATANVFAAYTHFFIDNVSIQVATTADIPANDNFTNAAVISGASAALTANNTHASKETGEPNHAGNLGGHSLWWSWLAPSNGIVALKASGIGLQPSLAAYTGNSVSNLILVAANTANPAQISFKAVAGTSYHIAVDGYNGATGSILLNLGFASDVAAPAIAITAPGIGASVTNPSVFVKGLASDNVAVAQVQFRLENVAGTNEYQVATGTNSWSATVSNLIPGYNTIRVRAFDTSTNYSATVTRTINYLLGSPVSLSISGQGSISGATNNQFLNLGNSYKFTALPAAGYGFSGWTGDVVAAPATITVVMRSNLMLQANFVDILKPMASITNFPISGKVSNELFTVKGKAGDNVAVTNVWFNLNNNGWISANDGGNWHNWNAELDLTPGTNTIADYAVDATGNFSPTNLVKLVYVLSAPLTISTNGKGSISPAVDGVLLQIGKNYTLTAMSAVGFAFTNWTDGTGAVVTNRPALSFLMASNLSFTANFADVARPTVSITNLPANGNVSNEFFTIKGKAADNVAVSNVLYNLNKAGWIGVDPGDNFAHWSASLDLLPGTNTIATYAVDTSGNLSLTNTTKVVYVLTAQLTVSTNGKGVITPALNGARLQIGKNYTLTAAPAIGFAFANWTDGYGDIATNKPTLTFMMASNLSFTANFVDIQKPVLAITNVVVGQHWSNSTFAVRGVASDNLTVSNVAYSLNQGGWNPATSGSPWTNWFCVLDLIPGTNTVSVYAMDAAGNVSATNTVKIFYVVSALVTVQINGGGLVAPNYNGHSLALGSNYSMKAVNTNGFIFSYWGGDVDMTTNLTVNFNLASNITIVANFQDVQRPTNTIAFPSVNQQWNTNFINPAGSAFDNWGVADVWVQINHSGWTEATSVNGFTNWISTNLAVMFDTNLLEAYAIDARGNASPTNRVTFIGYFPNSGMAPIPAGNYIIGNLFNDAYNPIDNHPTNVLLSAFLMDTNLVSYSQWQSVYNWATNHGYHFDNAGARKASDHPVQTVSWYDCAKWCNARSVKFRLTPVYYTDTNYINSFTSGHAVPVYANMAANGYRLPTEAEWETAARGGLIPSQRFPWGDIAYWDYANYKGDPLDIDPNGFSYDRATAVGYDPDFNDGVIPYTSPVGAAPNGYGLNDMAGNVNQWCGDWYGTPYGRPTTNNPTGPATGTLTYRVVRGGSWNATANQARCAFRGKQLPATADYYTGFRCVRRD